MSCLGLRHTSDSVRSSINLSCLGLKHKSDSVRSSINLSCLGLKQIQTMTWINGLYNMPQIRQLQRNQFVEKTN